MPVCVFSTIMMSFFTVAPSSAAPIRINIDSTPMTLEPPLISETAGSWVLHHIGDRLVEEHHLGQIQGNLAVSWNISSDRRTYTFLIASNRTFEDGSPVTAAAVSESFNRAVRYGMKSRIGEYLTNIDGVSVISKNSLRLHLKKPTSNFLQILSDASFTVYKSCPKRLGLCFTNNNFELVRISSEKVELKRQKDNQIFELIPLSFDIAEERYKDGGLEILRNYGIENLAAIRSINARKSVMVDERSYFIAFNITSTKFKNLSARESIFAALNFTELDSELAKSGIKRSSNLLSPSLAISDTNTHNQSPSKTATINTKNFSFNVLAIASHKLAHIADPLLKGTDGHLIELARTQFFERIKNNDYDAVLIGYGITVRDWDYISTLFESSSAHNFAKFHSEEIDKMLDDARSKTDPQTRFAAYREVLSINDSLRAYIPLFHVPLYFSYSHRLDPGFEAQVDEVTTPFISLEQVHWKK